MLNPVFVLISLVLAVLAAIFGYVMTLPPEVAHRVTMEGGFVEVGSSVGYFICVAALIFWGRMTFVKRRYYLLILLIALGLRELDFDKAFTAEGIFKSKFLISDHVPFIEKVIGGVVLLILLVCIVHMVRNHFKSFFIGLFRFYEVEFAIGVGFAFIVISKAIDGIERKLDSLGLSITEHTAEIVEYGEEILELGISLMFLIAIYAHFSAKFKAKH